MNAIGGAERLEMAAYVAPSGSKQQKALMDAAKHLRKSDVFGEKRQTNTGKSMCLVNSCRKPKENR